MSWTTEVGALERTPDRRPGSVRRTITIDGARPDGPAGDVVLEARGRDLLTDRDGAAREASSQRMRLVSDFVNDQHIHEILADPAEPALADLLELPSRQGFRRTLAERLPHRAGDGSILMAMLDDVPIVSGLSRTALVQRGVISNRPDDPRYLPVKGAGSRPTLAVTVVTATDDAAKRVVSSPQVACAGWAPGTSLTLGFQAGGNGYLTPGVVAPRELRGDDPLAWHELADLGPDGFRRWRRTDVWTDRDVPGLLNVDTWWRDAYVAAGGEMRVLHEYSVSATVDLTSMTVASITGIPRALPSPECARAATSPQELVGTSTAEIGRAVRSLVQGMGSCTHLTDALRGLGDVDVLARELV